MVIADRERVVHLYHPGSMTLEEREAVVEPLLQGPNSSVRGQSFSLITCSANRPWGSFLFGIVAMTRLCLRDPRVSLR